MSIKDRPTLFMILAFQKAGRLTPETELVESSSGNTAIGIAAIAATMGLKSRFFMSESVSRERVLILKAYGAEVVLTPAVEHTRGARERAIAYAQKNPRAIYMNQHDNENNPEAHYATTGPENWDDTQGQIDAVVLGLGTGGSFSGVSRFLMEQNPAIRVIGFEPAGSPVYSGGSQAGHHLTGIGPGFIAPNFAKSRERCDEIVLVKDEDAYERTRRIARREGLLVGITSGASAKVAGDAARRPAFKGKTIVCFFYDTGERYLSTQGLFDP